MTKMGLQIQHGVSHVQQDTFAFMKELQTSKATLAPRVHFVQRQPKELYHAPREHSAKIMVQLLRLTAVRALLDITVHMKMGPSQKLNAQKDIFVLNDHRIRHYARLGFIATEQ